MPWALLPIQCCYAVTPEGWLDPLPYTSAPARSFYLSTYPTISPFPPPALPLLLTAPWVVAVVGEEAGGARPRPWVLGEGLGGGRAHSRGVGEALLLQRLTQPLPSYSAWLGSDTAAVQRRAPRPIWSLQAWAWWRASPPCLGRTWMMKPQRGILWVTSLATLTRKPRRVRTPLMTPQAKLRMVRAAKRVVGGSAGR